jgi:hypothetical protein
MFWQPITHSLNTGGHWIVARGWDWVTPSGIKSTLVDTSNAIKEVVTQGPKFQQMLRQGSALMSAGLNNKEFYNTLAKTFGEQIIKDPKRWNPMIRAFGFVGANAAADFVKSFYGAMSKVLWKVNDVFMMQRVMELERKGMSTAQAIKEAERHIPNYRIPSEVLGSRTAQQIITAPVINSFSRYHYGAMSSFGHMATDLLKGDAKTKFEATGHIAALAFLGFFAAPWINKAIQMATGNPKASGGARGPWAIPSNLRDMYNGDAGIFQGLSRFITISPLLKTAGETMTNRDWFTGKPIVEPGDQRQGRYGAMAGQTAEHLGENLVSPYNAATTAARQGKALPKSLVEQSFGISDPSATQEAKKQAAIERQNTDAASRHKHPKGLIESLGNQLSGLH